MSSPTFLESKNLSNLELIELLEFQLDQNLKVSTSLAKDPNLVEIKDDWLRMYVLPIAQELKERFTNA